MCWAAAAALARSRPRLARRRGAAAEIEARRAARPIVAFEHLAFLLVLLSGAVLMWSLGWGIGQARWLGLKLGLVAFLLIPLEAMHAWIWHGWIAPGLRRTTGAIPTKELERGIGMDDMLSALSLPLLGLALPLLVWLSVARPF